MPICPHGDPLCPCPDGDPCHYEGTNPMPSPRDQPRRASASMTLEAVLALLQAECDKLGSQKAWARANGISIPYVNDVLHGRREPGPAILAPLGLEKVITYRAVTPPAILSRRFRPGFQT